MKTRNKRYPNFFSAGLLYLVILLPLPGLAISLGDLRINSGLNQPLQARVVLQTGDDDIRVENIEVRLASESKHQQIGLPFPSALHETRFQLIYAANGDILILLTTDQAITEPLVSFLLEVDWREGRLLKEVALMLDPPEYPRMPTLLASTTKAEKVVQRPAIEPYQEQPIFVAVQAKGQRLAEFEAEETPAPPARPRSRSRRIVIENGQYGPVKSGDNLYRIARAANPDGNNQGLQETMRAIFEANPEAFSGSMDRIKRGAVLIIPDFSVAASALDKTENPAPVEIEKPIATPAPVEEDSSDSGETATSFLEILPMDKTAMEIARQMSGELQEYAAKPAAEAPAAESKAAEDVASPQASPEPVASATKDPVEDPPQAAATQQPVQETVETVREGDTEIQTDKVSTVANVSTLNNEVSRLQSEREGLRDELGDMRSQLAQAREDLNRLMLARESAGRLQSAVDRDSAGSIRDSMLQWAPWIVMALLLPLLLFFFMRKRKPEEIYAEPEYTSPSATQTFNRDNLYRDAPIIDTAPVNEFESATLPAQESPPADENVTAEIKTSPVFGAQPDSEESYETSDLELSGSDTHESFRPEFQNEHSTQIMQREERLAETDASLDMAQEAEIYLAYEQYSLAERTIKQLFDSDPGNDRNRILQLKLFAETARMTELQSLSVELLQKYPDPESGMHQQIQNICERAFSRHAMTEMTQAGSESTLPVKLDDTAEGANGIDSTLDDLTAETLYSHDISDYLSEDTLSELDELGTNAMNVEYEDFTHTLLDEDNSFDDLTEDEMDAISVEMELMDEPEPKTVEEGDFTASYSDVENFSDTDFQLPVYNEDAMESDFEDPLPDHPDTELDIAFDLDSEIHKIAAKEEVSEEKDQS